LKIIAGDQFSFSSNPEITIFTKNSAMPYLKIQSNKEIADKGLLMKEMTALLADLLKKPEKYIMISIEPVTDIYFDGNDGPAAFVELKSIGFPPDSTPQLSEAICGLLHRRLVISPDRVYIEFSDSPRHMFGWNSDTF